MTAVAKAAMGVPVLIGMAPTRTAACAAACRGEQVVPPGRLARFLALVPPAGLRRAMASPPYVELHAHSTFSFHDGPSTPAELAGAALELGYPCAFRRSSMLVGRKLKEGWSFRPVNARVLGKAHGLRT